MQAPRALVYLVLSVLGLLFSIETASAEACPNPNDISINHQPQSYCELCGVGEVTLRVEYGRNFNPEITNLAITEDFQASGLEPIPGTTTFNTRFGAAPLSTDPTQTAPGEWTWDLGGFWLDPAGNNSGNRQYLDITFQVRRSNSQDEEGLYFDSKSVQATLAYTTDTDTCSDETDSHTLDMNAPNPNITKLGRNVDASQGGYTNPVYGHNNDDIIWRIQISNSGLADMQDLMFTDLMQDGNFEINYACPSEGEALSIANANGAGPVGGCIAAGNSTLSDWEVTNPFGDAGTTNYPNGGSVNGFSRNLNGWEVDVAAGGSTFIYLVGKVTADGSCTSGGRTNTANQLEFGCEVDANGVGGIPNASSSSAVLRTYVGDVNAQLTINRQLTGINPGQPVGSRGYVTLTITNNTGGTVKDIYLDDVLPPEYVVDPTYWSSGLTKTLPVRGTPVVGESSIDPLYGSYDGMIDRLTWENPQGSLSSPSQDPLQNTGPQFRLWSSTSYSDNGETYEHLLRHGDEITVTFPIVLISQDRSVVEPYDLAANLDVTPEVTGDGTDPAYTSSLSNSLTIDYNTLCNTQGAQQLTFNENFAAFPEDLDVAINGTTFILTNDPNQQLTLPVTLTNNGGHEARNYHLYVTFGTTMDVVSAPAGCSVVNSPNSTPSSPDEWQPIPRQVWVKDQVTPIAIPSTATVYECTSPTVISPNQSVNYNFNVIKTSDAGRIAVDDLTFRADVIGEILLDDGTPLWFPTPVTRADGLTDPSNNYSLDAVWARVIGFNLKKSQVGECSENPPASFDGSGFEQVEIGEECTYLIETGGWFGFETPGYAYIAVQNIDVVDEIPDGQAYISNTDPYAASTSLIGINNDLSRNPADLTAPDERWFDWRFNTADANRIEIADEWFIVNTTTRLLNKPVDTRAVPNVHSADSFNVLNSTFDATFSNLNTGAVETYTLGPSTVGYPNEPIRRVDLRITEPNLLVDKQVCNETLYGSGTGCSNFVDLADDGDTQDSYIYRITLTNQASSAGYTRAPAYDIVSSDVLDSSDMVYVVPFASDGLDNDGDGLIDGADSDGEGGISDNVVENGTPPVITYSHTHSSALLKLEPGSSVTFYYRVDPDDSVAPLQTLTNTVSATYDSLAGDSGNQTVAPGATGTLGGARFYTSADASAAVQILPLQTQPKTILQLSNTPLGGTPQSVSIGEEVEYELRAFIPVANLRNFVIRDELPAGIRCSEAPVVNLDAAPYSAAGFSPGGQITPTCTGNLVEWNFGDQELTAAPSTSLFEFPVTFIARVENIAANIDGQVISNGDPATVARLSYVNDAGSTVTLNFGQVDLEVREPEISLIKSFAVANSDAGDVLTVTVRAINGGTASAYNLQVMDDLVGTNLTYLGNLSGTDPPDVVDTTTLGPDQPIFKWNPTNPDYQIPVGGVRTFTFDVRVDTAAQPHEILNNTAQASWTSLPLQTTALNSSGTIGADGSADGMRNGVLPNNPLDTLNDYETEASAQTEVLPLTMNKTDLDPGLVPAVGARKHFQIEISLPEGTTQNLVATDNLNFGALSYVLENNASYDVSYTFQDIASINGQSPSEGALTAFPADGATGNISWDIGTVVTSTEDDLTVNTVNPVIRVDYYARINNDAATNAGDGLQNQATVNYSNGETAVTETLIDTTPAVSVVEPLLNINKTVVNVSNPGNPPIAGDILRYSLNITASSGASYSDALDVSINDDLSLGLAYSGNSTVNGAGNTINDPVTSGDGITTAQSMRWSLADANADIDVSEGSTVTVTYDVVVLDNVLPGQQLTNSASIQWTSLDGADAAERDGTASPAYNDYFTGPVTAILNAPDLNTISKARLTDTFGSGDANVRIGDIVDYELRLTLQEGTSGNVLVSDSLPQGLAFEGLVSINGDSSAPFTSVSPFTHTAINNATVSGDPAIGPTTVTIDIGDIVNAGDGNPANNDFIIVYRARVLDNVFAQVNSTTLTNAVTFQYDNISGTQTRSSSQAITLLQPNLSVSKSASAAGGDTVIEANELVTYTVDISNSGTAPAYDLMLQDIIPVGMRNGTATITMVSTTIGGTPVANPVPIYDATTGIVNWNLDTGVADSYTIPAGQTLSLVYQVQADPDIGAGLTLTNQAQGLSYYSFDDEAAPTAGSVSGVREIYGPTNTASTTLTTDAPGAPLKENPASTDVTIGETFSYRITIPASPHPTALHDVRILDNLPAGSGDADLGFVSVSKVSGSLSWTPVNTGTATSLVIEDTTDGIDIPAGEQIVIDVAVIVNDSSDNVAGVLFNNTASYTYNQLDDTPATQQPGGSSTTADMRIVEPQLVMQKSGPGQMQLGVPETFTLDLQNTGNSTAWDITVTDLLPNPSPGGMCDTPPANITAQVFEADGSTAVSGVLVEGTDYVSSFTGDPTCSLTLTMQTADAAVAPTQRLIITYEAELDLDNPQAQPLTNIAGATEWFSLDTAGAGATGQIRTYSRALTDGSLLHEDAHTVTSELPELSIQKTVDNVTSSQSPASTAQPGDTLSYTVTITNISDVPVTDFTLRDELDRLNTTQSKFAAGTLNIITLPSGTDVSDSNGGTNGTGLLEIQNLNLDAQGGANDSLTFVYEVTLAPVLTNGSQVLNQAQVIILDSLTLDSDDPNIGGAEDPTAVTINSAPAFEVWKTSQDLTDDPATLEAGDRLRYTITVKNTGTEDAVNVTLRDQIPGNTSYDPGSTTLNGSPVGDPSNGVSALESGMLINAPENTTAGYLRADSSATTSNVSTITFDVIVDTNAVDGTVISNQGFVNGQGQGSGSFPEQPSDDPSTALVDDPTIDVVGSVPLVDSQKIVSIVIDNDGDGIVDPGDRLQYTIITTNFGALPATGVVLTDAIPADTTYVPNSTTLNTLAVPDPAAGVSALESGLDISSSDLTPPLPTAGNGTLSPGQAATVTFEVDVTGGVLISNQGTVSNNELPDEPTDQDGIDSNGDQPTIIGVGNVQQLSITKDVNVVGGGAALPGGELEYVIRVTNISGVAATDVTITDNLDLPVANQLNYVAGSAIMNGSTAGISFSDPVLTADYSTPYGDLQPGDTVVLRFRAQIDSALAIGTTITNTADVSWDAGTRNDSASVSVDVGGTPGVASLNGNVWHDADFDLTADSGERLLANWTVNLYRNSVLYASTQTDSSGQFQFNGVAPNDLSGDNYELRFTAPGSGANTASLGETDSPFTDGQQSITNIVVTSGSNTQNLNLPIQPNGVVYDAVLRTPVAGATLVMLRASDNLQLPDSCFDDTAQQGQVSTANGYYKFALNFTQPECNAGDDYLIQITPPASGYTAAPSVLVPPTTSAATAAFDVPSCPGTASDAITATTNHCEAQISELPPATSIAAGPGTRYHLNLTLNDTLVPGHSEMFNNHIPLDPELGSAVSLSKVAAKVNVTRSDLVPYTIRLNNTLSAPLAALDVIDTFPAGFKYVKNSARVNDTPMEPAINGQQLTWSDMVVAPNSSLTIKLLLIVGSGVNEGEYINRARVLNNITGDYVSGEASATVRVVPDPTFDCSDIIGKVFDDQNLNGYQDEGEPGLPGARVYTARGLEITADEYGRFHVTCAITPNQDRGSNFIMKLDERSLPTGYRVTTENPRVQRVTRGKIVKFNFGATIHRVVKLDMADAVFEPGSAKMRPQWIPRLDLLVGQLRKAASVLRLSYLAENEDDGLVEDRLDAVKQMVEERWEEPYKLRIETEVFWRGGGPDERGDL
ncbi:MAG: isopeptide-forming domain-containing fimbrial protein [Thiohalophilus sp.]